MDQWENDPQSWNLYVYVRNNPFLFVDPTGRQADCSDVVASGGTCVNVIFREGPSRDLHGELLASLAEDTGWDQDALAQVGNFFDAVLRLTVYDYREPLGGSYLLEAATLIPVAKVLKIPKGIKLLRAARAGAQLTGQMHHGISRTVHKALQQHPNLRGLYQGRDPRFVTQARDALSHRGYQQWHRNLDTEVAGWIRNNPNATPAQFESYLRGVYQRPDILERFPSGL